MAERKELEETVNTLMKGMDHFVSTKTVVGEPIEIGETIIVPLVNVSFGVGAGVFLGDKKHDGAGGLGGKVTPSAVLIIHNGTTRLINIAEHTGIDKILDLVPDFVDRFRSKTNTVDPETKEKAKDAMKEMIDDAVSPDGE